MAFIDFIEKLQKKPRHVKIRIMWLVVAVCMLFVFAGWLWSLNSLTAQTSLQSNNDGSGSNSWGQIKQDMPSLWSSLSAGISNVFSTIKDDLQNQNTQKSASSSPSALSSVVPSPSDSSGPAMLPLE